MRVALFIALGGAFGTLSRYGLGQMLKRWLGGALPYGTFAVNVLGSFIIGYLMVHFANRGQMDSHLRMALTVGFLGGFTTYSSFAFETVSFVQAERLAAAGGYVLGTLVVAGVACYIGMLAASSVD